MEDTSMKESEVLKSMQKYYTKISIGGCLASFAQCKVHFNEAAFLNCIGAIRHKFITCLLDKGSKIVR